MDEPASNGMTSHPPDEVLEAYVFQRLKDAELESLEEHLLWCDKCRVRLEETETYIAAMRRAARKIRDEDFFRPRRPTLRERFQLLLAGSPGTRVAWGVGLAAVAAFVLLLVPATSNPPNAYQDISLTALRGGDKAEGATTELWPRLHLSLQQMPAISHAVVTVVDAGGKALWQSKSLDVTADAKELVVPVDRKLAKGNYWVRLTAATGPVLREYPLLVQ